MKEGIFGPAEQEARMASDLAADLLRQAVWGCTQNENRHPEASALVTWAHRVAAEWSETRRKKIAEAREKDAAWHKANKPEVVQAQSIVLSKSAEEIEPT